MSSVEERIQRRVRRWTRVAIPLVGLDAILNGVEQGHTVSILIVASAWMFAAWLTVRWRALVVVELLLLPVSFSLVGVGSMGVFSLSMMGLAARAVVVLPSALVALATTVPCALVLVTGVPTDPFPVSPLTLLLPAAVMFVLGRLLRSSAATAVRAEDLAEQLRSANARLERNLVDADELAASRERTRIARELHDSLGHCLTAAHAHLQVATRTVQVPIPDGQRALGAAADAVARGIVELRRSVSALRDPQQTRALADRGSRLSWTWRASPRPTHLTTSSSSTAPYKRA